MRLWIGIAAVALAACATPQQRAERAIAQYAPFCETLGYQRGTTEWANCIANSRQAQQARADAALGIGLGMLANQPQQAAPPMPVTCRQVGAWTTCQ